MKTFIKSIFVVGVVFSVSHLSAETLKGDIGSYTGSGWQSSWINLSKPTNFKQGDKLKLKLMGTAKKVVVRLLPKGTPSDSPVGIDGEIKIIPKSGLLEISLNKGHTDITQISVHAGAKAWSTNLGKNGNAILTGVERSN